VEKYSIFQIDINSYLNNYTQICHVSNLFWD